jgi:hypothetical protein
MGTPITAYGVAVRQGYADSTAACANQADDTALVDGAGTPTPIQLFSHNAAFWLAKSPGNAIATIYTDEGDPEANDFADGQVIYLPAQALSPALGTISSLSAGYYVLVEADYGGGTGFQVAAASALPDTTACPFPNRQSVPPGPRYSTKFVDNNMSELVTQYDRGDGLSDFIPFRMKVRGPSNLRRRSTVYKVTKK